MISSARFLPSLFTILNIYCGFLSIINAANNDLNQACLFIIYAALFDSLDGVVARFTRTSSKFGVELDSLADLISFGTAPSFILYKYYFYNLGGLGMALSSLILIFASLRLARFNTQLAGYDKNFFSGLPVPVSAITISSFFLFYFEKNLSLRDSEITVYILAIMLPLLMISKLKYDVLPKFSLIDFKSHVVKYFLIFISILLILLTRGEGLFIFCLFYLSTGILRGLKNQLRKRFRGKSIQSQSPEEELKFKPLN